ncbi:MAG TPA: sensor histidine kinase, partial [Lachnospiraceae bacterium]|nr:sensor histidine kinase [Lachnospiraceae bacterium]
FCLIAVRLMARVQFVQFTEYVCHQLDSIIEDTPADSIQPEEESLPSKIGAKLRKIREITQGAAERSEHLKENVQELVSDISHQLKTPLSNIKMAAETLDDESMDRERRQFFVSGLKTQVGKLEFLIEAMMKISRLENGTIAPKPELSAVYELLQNAIEAVRQAAAKKHIKITSSESDLQLYFDMRWTAEALFNILDNAVKYMPDGGSITISACPMALYTRIEISDTGIGILPEHLNDIFKRFYRENRMRQTGGVGVGLYLTREIISRQGGYITAQSCVDKGTTISVYLQNDKTANVPDL